MTQTVFKPGKNCWRESTLYYGEMLFDCANYYRALHSAITKARHSIFIVGWDIDSRIDLLRGEDAEKADAPANIGELIAWKAKENPDLQIYLLRWDSSFAFFSDREVLMEEVWSGKTPDNVHICLDSTIPLGGSQHQKIVLIDDELAFSGGMDVAVQRWDDRDHKIEQEAREDVLGSYGPYHDTQIMVSGPIVKDFAELVRWRWHHACNSQSIPVRNVEYKHQLPSVWPDGYHAYFKNMRCAIARNIPNMGDNFPAHEVESLITAMFQEAKDFIYIENQFASRLELAEFLNKKLRENPLLKTLLISSFNPQGVFEAEAYWAGRIDFKNILEDRVSPARVQMAYSSVCDSEGNHHYKRIHSKVMTIDDRYLVVGSSNLNNRSMTIDTECDFVLFAETAEQRKQIEHVRDDLIAEHSGRTIDEVSDILKQPVALQELICNKDDGSYCLTQIDDTIFTDKKFQSIAKKFSDPEEPLVSPIHVGHADFHVRNPRKKALLFFLACLAMAIVGGCLYGIIHHFEWLNPDTIQSFLEAVRGTLWSLPVVCLIYLVGGLIFFPVTALSLATAAVFGALWGPIYGLCGALVSASAIFYIGRFFGKRGLADLGGQKVKDIDKRFSESGIIGVAAIRMLPIAPYTLVNLVAGVSSIRFHHYFLGTVLGMLPGLVAKGFVGDSLVDVFVNPSPSSLLYLTLGVSLWIGLVVGSQKLANKWQDKKVQCA